MSGAMLGPEGSSYLEAINSTNYDLKDHHSLSGSIKWTTAVLMTVVMLMVSARFIVRILFEIPHNRLDLKRALGSDDYLILGAAFATVSFSGFAFFGAQQGLGQHIWNILANYPSDIKIYKSVLTSLLTKLLYGCYCSYTVAIALTKLSIIASYLRLFPGRTFRRFLWIVGVFVVLMGITSLVVIILECDPPRASWDWTVPRSKCIDIQLFFYVSSAINVITDFALWFAPMRYFWKANMVRRQKFELMLLYAIGLVGCLAGLFRLGQLKGLKSADITYEGSLPLNCSMAEVSFGIICACVPPLRPALAPFFHKIRALGTTPKTDVTTPVTSPQANDFRAYQQQRLSRAQEVDNVEMDEFDQNFRQYLGASMQPPHARTNPSQASTIGERGSATSERIFL